MAWQEMVGEGAQTQELNGRGHGRHRDWGRNGDGGGTSEDVRALFVKEVEESLFIVESNFIVKLHV